VRLTRRVTTSLLQVSCSFKDIRFALSDVRCARGAGVVRPYSFTVLRDDKIHDYYFPRHTCTLSDCPASSRHHCPSHPSSNHVRTTLGQLIASAEHNLQPKLSQYWPRPPQYKPPSQSYNPQSYSHHSLHTPTHTVTHTFPNTQTLSVFPLLPLLLSFLFRSKSHWPLSPPLTYTISNPLQGYTASRPGYGYAYPAT
jgi:hypothetical protein